MKWNTMTFVTTKTVPSELPIRPHTFEIALVGRSNVGKSSLLNALALKASIAKTSQTPGKTRHLNLFYVGEHLSIVDLPGYGYAKRSREEQSEWQGYIEKYLKERECLRLLVLIVDIRRSLEKEERMILDLADSLSLPVLLVVNKSDTVNQSETHQANMRCTKEGLPFLFVSCRTGRNIDVLRTTIERLLEGGKDAISS